MRRLALFLALGSCAFAVAYCDFNTVRPPPDCKACGAFPAEPDATAPPRADVVTFAVDTVYLGDTVRGETATSATAWRSFGFNLDGKVTDGKSPDVCIPAAGSPPSVQADVGGACGYSGCTGAGADNSFGANILPILQSALSVPSPSASVTSEFRQGNYTLELVVTGLDGTTAQTNRKLSMETFSGGPRDGAADWPVLTTDLRVPNDLDAGSKYRFPDAYISKGTFVSGVGEVNLGVPFQGFVLYTHVNRATIVMDLSSDGMRVVNGTIAGVLDTEELVDVFRRLAGKFSKSLCGSAFAGIAQLLRQTSDIRVDGPNDPGLPCNGISLAIGFDATRIDNPKRVVQAPATLDPCGMDDAGKD